MRLSLTLTKVGRSRSFIPSLIVLVLLILLILSNNPYVMLGLFALILLVLVNQPVVSVAVPKKTTRRVVKCLLFGLSIALVVVIHEWPRWKLIADVHRAKTIIVAWTVRDEHDIRHKYAYELDHKIRKQFVKKCDADLGLDYVGGAATIPPTISLCLMDKDGKLSACYVICPAQGGGGWLPDGKLGGGRCPAMEALCEIASHGRRLSEAERKAILDDHLRSNWPGLGRFDYTLPAVPFEGTYTLPVLPEQDQATTDRKDEAKSTVPVQPVVTTGVRTTKGRFQPRIRDGSLEIRGAER